MYKNMIYLLFLLTCLQSCDRILSTKDKPVPMERENPFRIFLRDDSGYMENLSGGSMGVSGAEIRLKSKSYGIEYHFISDSSGSVIVEDAISDEYFITAVRKLTAGEMEIATGIASKNIQLKNKNLKVITLRADTDTTLVVPMSAAVSGLQLIISEIYGCGPPEAGLYYHDKYVEFYNQADTTVFLDGLLVGVVSRFKPRDPDFVYSKWLWMFPGSGKEYPLFPGQFAVCAEDAIDHRINAPFSVDLSSVRFEYYKPETPDIDNPDITNMIMILMVSGYDWLIGGEKDALVVADISPDSLQYKDEHYLIPHTAIIDGVEYLDDPTRLQDKKLHESIDAGATGGIQFYTGKSMERIVLLKDDKLILKDDNNSSLDFRVIENPTPEFHHDE